MNIAADDDKRNARCMKMYQTCTPVPEHRLLLTNSHERKFPAVGYTDNNANTDSADRLYDGAQSNARETVDLLRILA